MTMKKNAYFDLLNANHSLNKTRLALFNPFTLKSREWFTEGKESVVLCAWKTMPPGKSLPSERGRLVIVSLCVYTWFTRRRRIIHLADVAHVYESRSRARARSRKITLFFSLSILPSYEIASGSAGAEDINIFLDSLLCTYTHNKTPHCWSDMELSPRWQEGVKTWVRTSLGGLLRKNTWTCHTSFLLFLQHTEKVYRASLQKKKSIGRFITSSSNYKRKEGGRTLTKAVRTCGF